MGRGLRGVQSDGHKPVPHIITAALSVALSLGIANFAHLGPAGPQGSPGATTITTKLPSAGICAFYAKNRQGHTVLQLTSPVAPNSNAEVGSCTKGTYISVVPGK